MSSSREVSRGLGRRVSYIVRREDTSTHVKPAVVRSVHELGFNADGMPIEYADRRHDAAWQEGFEVGRREGFIVGEQNGRDDAIASVAPLMERAAQDLKRAITGIEAAAGQVRAHDAVALETLREEALTMALGVAEAVIGRELTVVTEPVRDALRRAMQLAPERGDVEVRLHSNDARTAAGLLDLVPGRDVVIVPDDSVERGACIVRVGACRVDAQIRPALERVREVFGDRAAAIVQSVLGDAVLVDPGEMVA